MTSPYRRKEVIGDCTLYLGDCRDILPTLGNVDALITSPPYGEQRLYGFEEMPDWRDLVSRALCLAPPCQMLVNLGVVHKDGEVFQYWNDLIEDLRKKEWRLFGWYVWDKGFGAPGNWNGRFAPAHEWVFHFNKQPRQVNKWIKTQERKASGSGLRKQDGSMSGVSSPEKCGQPFKVPDSVIRMPPHQCRGEIENLHPAIYPVGLPEHLAKSFTDECDLIVDPYCGSGTTGVACAKLGRRFIGIEIDEGYFNIACERIRKAYAQPDFFVALPTPKPKQETFDGL